jgi:hypothetical protein
VDPDSHRSALILAGWIGIGSKRIKMINKNIKSEKIMFGIAGCSLVWAESFSCSLDVLYVSLG